MYSRNQRLVYQRAFSQAADKIREARPPTEEEICAELSPCEQKALGYVTGEFTNDELEELENILVPCGC